MQGDKRGTLNWVSENVLGEYRDSREDLEELIVNPDFSQELADRVRGPDGSLEKAWYVFVAELRGDSPEHQFGGMGGTQERGISHVELFRLLRDHPKYKVDRSSRYYRGDNCDSLIRLRPRNHESIQPTKVSEAIRELELYIGVTPFVKTIKTWPVWGAFGIPRLYYKDSIDSEESKITVISLGYCDYIFSDDEDDRIPLPTRVVFPNMQGIPCRYECQHKEGCWYVNPKHLKEYLFLPNTRMLPNTQMLIAKG